MKCSYVHSLLTASFLSAATLALVMATESPASAYNDCTSSDCIIYDLSTQDTCTEVDNEGPTSDVRWGNGLSRNVDQAVKGGQIVAYKLQWFSGGWSGWYIPGVNDIDVKYNVGPNTLRRMWSYFEDHTHSYIICTKTTGAF
jgi:hypothetical protein